MLAVKPEAIRVLCKFGDTLLHRSLYFDKQFVVGILRMNPQALHVANSEGDTPFDLAVADYEEMIELFQGKMSFDEIVSAFEQKREKHHKRRHPKAVQTRDGERVCATVGLFVS